MELLNNLALGLSVAGTPINLGYCFIGVLLGTFVGVLPGLGPLATCALLLPMTIGIEPAGALIMLAGIYYGSQYGGSTTAILVNLPGESSSAVTAIDGYKMAQKGKAGVALCAAAMSSFAAGTIATVVIVLVAGPLTSIALSFGPAEYFMLMVMGLISTVALASGSIVKALGMITLGLLLGLTGMDMFTGMPRFIYGQYELMDGIDFVALAVGIYGVGEILRNLAEFQTGAPPKVSKINGLWPNREERKRLVAPTLRGTGIGSFLGVLPGGGALLASFVSYNIEKRVSKHGHEFGTGAIEGVAAPEAANNAGAQTSFIPMLALGIPSNVVMALLVGTMIMHGIVPGPDVVTKNPDVFWGLIVSMWIGNAMLVILNLPLVGLWVNLLKTPYRFLFPAIIGFCAIGVYSVNNSAFGIYVVAIAGIVGYIFHKLECEPTPLILGFILGPLLEEHLRRAMTLYEGDLTVFVTRPVSLVLLILCCIVLILVTRPSIEKKREAVFVEDN